MHACRDGTPGILHGAHCPCKATQTRRVKQRSNEPRRTGWWGGEPAGVPEAAPRTATHGSTPTRTRHHHLAGLITRRSQVQILPPIGSRYDALTQARRSLSLGLGEAPSYLSIQRDRRIRRNGAGSPRRHVHWHLLAQPGGFEGFLPIGEPLSANDLAVLHCPNAELDGSGDLNSAPTALALIPRYRNDSLAGI